MKNDLGPYAVGLLLLTVALSLVFSIGVPVFISEAWLGFTGNVLGAFMTLAAAVFAWTAVQRQIGVQHEANRIAQAAATAAVKALELSQKQSRAYFTCSTEAKTTLDRQLQVKLVIKNTGQSQARNMQVECELGYLRAPFLNQYFALGTRIASSPDDMGASSQDTIEVTSGGFPEDLAFSEGGWGPMVQCGIAFTDIFGDVHQQLFRSFRYVVPGTNTNDYMRLFKQDIPEA
ncbi:hypothetical protein [Bradyrhizobium sp. LTSP857]|uniref:hypothetical protein n=1 Tax=Bradyrhizobium sp. LTSP857 TaxID=1619231 RepID=UPI0005D1FD4D|nr:hypothetical protein [Bradyrhizobium sp. LTSP857]KJC36493.1 hypothetical protein UP06_32815 [Bradyrhizobium sp. LTSP857]